MFFVMITLEVYRVITFGKTAEKKTTALVKDPFPIGAEYRIFALRMNKRDTVTPQLSPVNARFFGEGIALMAIAAIFTENQLFPVR